MGLVQGLVGVSVVLFKRFMSTLILFLQSGKSDIIPFPYSGQENMALEKILDDEFSIGCKTHTAPDVLSKSMGYSLVVFGLINSYLFARESHKAKEGTIAISKNKLAKLRFFSFIFSPRCFFHLTSRPVVDVDSVVDLDPKGSKERGKCNALKSDALPLNADPQLDRYVDVEIYDSCRVRRSQLNSSLSDVLSSTEIVDEAISSARRNRHARVGYRRPLLSVRNLVKKIAEFLGKSCEDPELGKLIKDDLRTSIGYVS